MICKTLFFSATVAYERAAHCLVRSVRYIHIHDFIDPFKLAVDLYSAGRATRDKEWYKRFLDSCPC